MAGSGGGADGTAPGFGPGSGSEGLHEVAAGGRLLHHPLLTLGAAPERGRVAPPPTSTSRAATFSVTCYTRHGSVKPKIRLEISNSFIPFG